MTRRHQLGMASYDRFFPNQDTMPRGGFGNLIALPFQQDRGKRATRSFVDDEFVPHPRPVGLPRVASPDRPGDESQAIAREATRQAEVSACRSADLRDEESSNALGSPSSRGRRESPSTGRCPAKVQAVLAQRLFVEKVGLPPVLINRIKRLAAFQNPEFYKKQKMRLSTALTPRVIACAEDLPRARRSPRGCRETSRDLLAGYDIHLEIEDKRNRRGAVESRFQGELTAIQERRCKALPAHDDGGLRRSARHRQDRGRHIPTAAQRPARPSSSSTGQPTPRPMGCEALHRSWGSNPRRSAGSAEATEADGSARRRHDPEPGSQGGGKRPRGCVTAT